MATFFTNCHCIQVCICVFIYLFKYNLFSIYKVAFICFQSCHCISNWQALLWGRPLPLTTNLPQVHHWTHESIWGKAFANCLLYWTLFKSFICFVTCSYIFCIVYYFALKDESLCFMGCLFSDIIIGFMFHYKLILVCSRRCRIFLDYSMYICSSLISLFIEQIFPLLNWFWTDLKDTFLCINVPAFRHFILLFQSI